MMNHPVYLKKGDKIAITCPAKSLREPMTQAIALLQSWGLEVALGETVNAKYHQFAGTDALRTKDMQGFIDDPSIKAIIAARGGYGCLRIVDDIDWTPLVLNPKWIVGFSDITVFHLQLQTMALQSIHGQMPSTISESSFEGLESLRRALFGESLYYQIAANPFNKQGNATGEIIGGNLTLLLNSIASASDIDYADKILFIEEVGEYAYAVDRMLRALDRAGKFKHLKGMVLGGFTNIKQDEPAFGFSTEEILSEIVSKYSFPVCFGFPAGHLADNRALILGRQAELTVSDYGCSLRFAGA